MKVAILGASDRPERYAYKAMKRLESHGHENFLIHPSLPEIEGRQVFSTLSQVEESIDTIAMYVNPKISSGLVKELVSSKPRRIIFNPGSENREIYSELIESGIDVEEACVLVLLSTDQF